MGSKDVLFVLFCFVLFCFIGDSDYQQTGGVQESNLKLIRYIKHKTFIACFVRFIFESYEHYVTLCK